MRRTMLTKCCTWLAVLTFASPLVVAAPPADQPSDELAVLEPLVGSWVFGEVEGNGFSARQEYRWILDKQFLEIDTQVFRPGHPTSSWRTLVGYDQEEECYRQWRFSDGGAVSTASGEWDADTSTLRLTGRTSDGHDSESAFKIMGDDAVMTTVREYLDDNHTRMSVARFMLTRVDPADAKPAK